MCEAAMHAGFIAEEVTLLDEPIEAAYYYDQQQAIQEGESLLVYDLEGTFKAALLQKKQDSFEYLTEPILLEQCGGMRFDQMLYIHLMECFPEIHIFLQAKLDEETTRLMRLQLKKACVELKHQLSIF